MIEIAGCVSLSIEPGVGRETYFAFGRKVVEL